MRPLSEYKTEDGYEDPDNNSVYYSNLEDLLQLMVLGHCGCGSPSSNLLIFYNILNFESEYRKSIASTISQPFSSKPYDEYQLKVKNFICENWHSFANLVLYVLDDKKIMAHGSNITGAWVLDQNFVDALNIWYKEEYEKNKFEIDIS